MLTLGAFLSLGGCSSGGGGGSSASGGRGSGSGGASASGGTVGSGGASSTGGSAQSGGSTGSGGNATGGATASGGTSGSGGTSAASGGVTGTGGAIGAGGGGGRGLGGGGSGGAGTVADCSTLPLCDDFETGSALNTSLWTIVPSSGSGTAAIDSPGAHGSGHSLKVTSPDRLYLRNPSVIGTLGSTVYVRFFVKFMSALAGGHGAMIVTHPMMVDQFSQSNELRFGSQDMVFHWNTDSDAANLPDVSPNGDAASFKPMANNWYCIELTINTGGDLSVAIDGADQAGLKDDGTPTMDVDQNWIMSGSTSLSRYSKLADFNFGWESYGAGGMTLWFDDVALSGSPIGCPKN